MVEKQSDAERQEAVAALLPEEAAGYYAGLDKQHFGAEGVGSRFTEVGGIQELLELRHDQEGTVDGDDRDFFAGKGSPESAFAPSSAARYIKVMTPGKMGVKKAADLPEDTPVKVVTIPGKNTCSLVVEVSGDDQLEDVDYATVIVGGNSKQNESDPEPTTKEMVWTAHPGYPTPPPFADTWQDGETITIADVKKELGDDFHVSMKVV
ncbi:hypothetical protein ACFL21_04540 [Patescibacteria group bacterium]